MNNCPKVILLGITALVLFVVPVFGFEQMRKSLSLDDMAWKISKLKQANQPFTIEKEVKSGYFREEYDDSPWDNMKVPANWHGVYPWTYPGDKAAHWNTSIPAASSYVCGWYRLKFKVPENFANQRVFIKFHNVGWEAHVFVNGNKVGIHKGVFTKFEFDITDYIRLDKENCLAIWVTDDFPGKRPTHTYGKLWGPGYNMGGIVGPVELIAKPTISIKQGLITPRLNSSELDLEVFVENPTNEIKELTVAAAAQIVGVVKTKNEEESVNLGKIKATPGISIHNLKMSLKNPIYWTPEEPNLYQLFLLLKDKTGVVEIKAESFGFREFRAQGTRFYLNNKRIRLYGGNILTSGMYNGYTKQGREAFQGFILRQKDYKSNALRYHINGPDLSEIMGVADETGMLMIAEFGMHHNIFNDSWTDENTKVFLPNALEELKEWIYQNYNHPSVVLWSLSNEVWYDQTADMLSKMYEFARKLDTSTRPISADSGSHSFGIPTVPVKTDVFDDHNYTMTSTIPVSLGYETFNLHFADLKKIYGKIDKPCITFESLSLGFEKPPEQISAAKELPVEEYIRIASKCPQAVSLIGLRAFIDPNNNKYLYEKVGKEALEMFRKELRLEGFHPWWSDRGTLPECSKIVYSPLFIGVDKLNKNQFAGEIFKPNIIIINDSLEPKDLNLEIIIKDGTGQEIHKDSLKVGLGAGEELKRIDYAWSIPESLDTGFYNLFLQEKDFTNKYTIFVLNKKDRKQEITTKYNIALYQPEYKGNGYNTKKILEELKIKHTEIKSFDNLSQFQVLIIGNGSEGNKDSLSKIPSGEGLKIRRWVEDGGKILCFEQEENCDIPWLTNYKMVCNKNIRQTFADLAVPNHPAFQNLTTGNFDLWNGNDGILISTAIKPLTKNVLSAVYTFSQDGLLSAVIEAKVGKGDSLISMLKATERYNQDSAATLYLENVLNYFLGEKVSDLVRVIEEPVEKPIVTTLKSIRAQDCFIIDLSKNCNVGFKDDVSGDGKGGWWDAGTTDLRHAPIGEFKYYDIPFQIIDPAKNDGKSCIVLKSAKTPLYPLSVKGIAVNKKAAKLFFLHTGWFTSKDKIAGYAVNYEDGTKETIDLIGFKNIGDWWTPMQPDISDEMVNAWSQEHPVMRTFYGFQLTYWNNPKPEKVIKTIDFISEDQTSTPALIAITGGKYKDWAEINLGSPWEMNSAKEIAESIPKNLNFQNGELSYKLTDQEHSFIVLNLNGKEIDTTEYNKLIFRTYFSSPGAFQVQFRYPETQEIGFTNIISTKVGWQECSVDLSNEEIWKSRDDLGKALVWGGAKHKANLLRLDLYSDKGATIKIDWVRLTQK